MGRQANARIDCNATVEQHYEHIRVQREGYLSNALKSPLNAAARQKVLQAALRYLHARTAQSPPQSLSQTVFSQGPAVTAGPLSSFQSLLSSILTDEIPPEMLIDACVKAADGHFLPLLEKCLSLLANVGPILDKKSVALDSQTQQDDEALPGRDDIENQDPQMPAGERRSVTPSQDKVVVRRTGQSFVDDFVCKLVEGATKASRSQSGSNNIFAVSVAREAPLSVHTTQVVFYHLTKNMKRVDLVELPAYIYQLLLYASSRGDSKVKSGILMRIAQVFSAHEQKLTHQQAQSQSMLAEDEDAIIPSAPSLTDLRQIQGTALLHIEYVVKQDPSLASEIVRLSKAGVETPNHFLTAYGTGIVLSMARAIFSRIDVLPVLRDAISRFDKERTQRKNSLFLSRVSMNDIKMADPCRALLHIAKCTCENGWDNVKESLLQFALVILDKPLPVHSRDGISVSERLVESIFLELFIGHPAMRASILEQLTTRVALQEKSAPQSASVLAVLARQIPFFVLEHVRYIRDGIEVLTTLPPWLAHALMNAYKPLLAARQDLYDYFQLVSRKSLFHHNVSSRAVSIVAFLTLVSLSKAPGLKKRTSTDIEYQSQSVRAHDKDLDAIMESFQPLRRVFSYPAALRAYMYMNASHFLNSIESETVAQNIATVMSDVFVNHLRRFVDIAKAPYLLLDHCVNIKGLVEPLGDLIWCLALVEARKCPMSYKTSYILDVAKKIAGVSVQDFGITKEGIVQAENEKAGDFDDGQESDDNTPRTLRNKIRVLGSVCEALIHSVLIIPQQQQEWSLYSDIVFPLLSLRKKVVDILCSAGAGTASDAFIELGGIATLERLRPGLRLLLQRSGKSIHLGKKTSGRKAKGSDAQTSAHGGQGPSHKLGMFSVLASTSSKPTLPFTVSIQILEHMAGTKVDNAPYNDIFKGKENDKELQELRVYLLSIAKKHIDDLISNSSKSPPEEKYLSKRSFSVMMDSVTSYLRVVMGDFEKYKETTPIVAGQGGIHALQAAESCAMALSLGFRYEPKCLSAFCKALTPVTSEFDMRDASTLYETATELLEELIDALAEDGKVKEVTVALHIHSILVDTISSILDCIESKCVFLRKRMRWSVDALSQKNINDSRTVKTIVKLCLTYTENNDDLRRAMDLCVRLLLVLGDCDSNAEPPNPNDSNYLNPKLVGAVAIDTDTCFAVVEGILDATDKAVVEVEWCLNRMVSLEIATHGSDMLDQGSGGGDSSEKSSAIQEEMAKQAIRAEDAALLRLENVVGTLRALATCSIGKWSLQERLLRLITKTYKVLSVATNAQAKRKGDPRTSFIALLNEVKGLAPTLWTYLAFIGADPVIDSHRKKSGKATSEARVMPQLIYEVERFEKVLISAQKRTKINLLRGMRRNIARDFRIREDALDEAEREDENEEVDACDEQGSRNPRSRERAKRRRVS